MSSIIDLDCSICYLRFVDPRILNCGHTFCFGCLSRIHSRPPHKGIPCPECNAVTAIPNGVGKLIPNWTVRKVIDSEKESSAAQSSLVPCKLHNSPSVLYCQVCSELICSKCLGDHSDHLSEIGPLEGEASSYEKCIRSVVDQLKSRLDKLKTGAGFWQFYSERLSLSEKQQMAELDSLDNLISHLKKKHELLKSEIQTGYEKKHDEIRQSSAPIIASHKQLFTVLQKLNSLPPSSQVSSLWPLLAESKDLLNAHPAPTNFPDLSTLKVDTVSLDALDVIHELTSNFAVEQGKLLEHPILVREYHVTFPKVSSAKYSMETRAAVFDRIQMSLVIVLRGTKAETKGKLGLFFKIKAHEGFHFGIRYGMCIINQLRPTESLRISTEATMSVVNQSVIGCETFCDSDLVLDPKNGFCIDDTIQIHGVLEVHRTWFRLKSSPT